MYEGITFAHKAAREDTSAHRRTRQPRASPHSNSLYVTPNAVVGELPGAWLEPRVAMLTQLPRLLQSFTHASARHADGATSQAPRRTASHHTASHPLCTHDMGEGLAGCSSDGRTSLARGAVESVEALARALGVVAEAGAGARHVHGVHSGGTLGDPLQPDGARHCDGDARRGVTSVRRWRSQTM
jgi:hypothetical protein